MNTTRAIVVTEGLGEFKAFKTMFNSLPTQGGSISPSVLHANIQPDGPLKGIAKACEPLLRQARAKKTELFVLVLDREQQSEALGPLSASLKSELSKTGNWPFRIEVVYKDRAFENWLIADLSALRKQPARFKVSEALRGRVEPDKADKTKALDLLKQATIGRSYDKMADGNRIAQKFSLSSAARHSRSLRHLLHVLGHLEYENQCRRPNVGVK